MHTYIAKVMGKGKSQVGKMDAILTDPQFDSRIQIILMYSDECGCTKVRACRRSMRREREVLETTGNSTDDSS